MVKNIQGISQKINLMDLGNFNGQNKQINNTQECGKWEKCMEKEKFWERKEFLWKEFGKKVNFQVDFFFNSKFLLC